MASLVSDADIRAYGKDGIICLRGAFDRSWLDDLADGIDRVRAAPGPNAKEYAPEGAGSFFTDHHCFLRFAPFHRFLYDSPAAQIAAEVMGASRINLYDEHLLLKEPGTATPTYWHHDAPYFHIQGDQIVSIWLPLDPVTEESGAMRFAVGSHRWGKLFLPIRIGAGDPVPGDGDEIDDDIAGPAPDIDADPERYPTVTFDLEPGDCVVFHGRTLHAATGNRTAGRRRRALSLRFIGDDITWKNRHKAPLVFSSRMNDGDTIDTPECPRVWPKAYRDAAPYADEVAAPA